MSIIKTIYALFREKFKTTNKNIWVFSSYYGKYDDSPKLLSEYIHNNYPQINIYWLLSRENFNNVPEYVNKLDFSDQTDVEFAKSTASVLIDNIYGIQCSFLYGGNFKKRIEFKIMSFFKKKVHQHTYSFWHGMGMKASMGEREDLMISDISFGNMYFLLGSKETIAKIKRRTLNKANDYALVGCPRNDELLSNNINKDLLRSKLHIPAGKKVVLFAPTFRGNTKTNDYDVEMSGIKQMEMLDVKQLLSTISKRFGGEYVFVLRVHHLVEDKIDFDVLCKKFDGLVISGNISPNMIDYLNIADVLISDYSSTSFDFLLTKKPIFLYIPDFVAYSSKYKLIRNLDDLPFSTAYMFSDLISNIFSFDEKAYCKRVESFIDKEGYLVTNNSLQIVMNYILKKEKIV